MAERIPEIPDHLLEALHVPGTAWVCLPLEVAVLFQALSRPDPGDADALAWGARLHHLARKAEDTRRWYARHGREREQRRIRNAEERRRARRRWYERLKRDPERYQAWRDKQNAQRRARRDHG